MRASLETCGKSSVITVLLMCRTERPRALLARQPRGTTSCCHPALQGSDLGANREADRAVGVAGGEGRACER